jgi:flagellar hook-associated protein 3 FlgL
MVTRVSTSGTYATVLANLMSAQGRQIAAGNQVATQKKGDDLKDYAKNAEMITAMRTIQSRLKVYQDQNSLIADKLATQDMALNQVTDAAASARQVIADAVANGRVDTLMEDLKAQMRNASEGLNARYGGKYLFGGGQIDTKPVTAAELSDLTAGPPIASFFQNDDYKAQAKLDDSTSVNTGFVASELGTELMTAFQAIQTFHEGPDGPFTGKMTDAQKTFLQGQLGAWDDIRANLTNATARNGLVQKQVDRIADDLVTRDNAITGMMGDIVDADMTNAITQLQMAQTAVQAAAQVFQSLQSSSLLNVLK